MIIISERCFLSANGVLCNFERGCSIGRLSSNVSFLVVVVHSRPANRALDGAHPLLESLVSLSCAHRRSERPLCSGHIGQSGVVGPCRSVGVCQEYSAVTGKSHCGVPDHTPTASPAAIAEPRAVVSTIAGRTTSCSTGKSQRSGERLRPVSCGRCQRPALTTPSRSAWICMSRLLTHIPPSTFSKSSETPESLPICPCIP